LQKSERVKSGKKWECESCKMEKEVPSGLEDGEKVGEVRGKGGKGSAKGVLEKRNGNTTWVEGAVVGLLPTTTASELRQDRSKKCSQQTKKN